jgi:GNAT superfamily N-acetyltransferase
MDRAQVNIGRVEPKTTLGLRHQVLRPHQRLEDLDLPGSDHPDSGTFGAVEIATGDVLGTAAVSPEDAPEELDKVLPSGRRWRLRSMATREGLRGRGIGAGVLNSAIAHIAARGGGVLWCNARLPAVRFYVRAGFRAFGDPWEEPEIGPHVMMWRLVEATHGEKEQSQ